VPELVEVIRAHEPALSLGSVAAAVLAQMRADGWRVGILTNGLPATQRAKVEALGLDARVDAVRSESTRQAASRRGRLRRRTGDARRAPQTVFIGDDLIRDIPARATPACPPSASPRPRRLHDGDADAIARLEDVAWRAAS
jgi:putative hydrolase of the HAD superfamily